MLLLILRECMRMPACATAITRHGAPLAGPQACRPAHHGKRAEISGAAYSVWPTAGSAAQGRQRSQSQPALHPKLPLALLLPCTDAATCHLPAAIRYAAGMLPAVTAAQRLLRSHTNSPGHVCPASRPMLSPTHPATPVIEFPNVHQQLALLLCSSCCCRQLLLRVQAQPPSCPTQRQQQCCCQYSCSRAAAVLQFQATLVLQLHGNQQLPTPNSKKNSSSTVFAAAAAALVAQLLL